MKTEHGREPTPLTADTVSLAASLRKLLALERQNPLLEWLKAEMRRELRRRAAVAWRSLQ